MKIKQIEMKQFKRFTNLTVTNLPDTAKLVIIAGPNGCGKSSLFDALYVWHKSHWKGTGTPWNADYHPKLSGVSGVSWKNAVDVKFHGDLPDATDDRRKALYVRSAYRNDPEFQVQQLTKNQSALLEERFARLIENDATVSRNYQRMASQGLEDVYELEDPSVTIGEFREKTIGEIRKSVARLFPDLSLNSLGNPLTEGTFKFTKGESHGFKYMNLSGGEKAAFDLILDLIIKRREYNATVFCIDEPEAHMNTKLQGDLLSELYDLVPENCQLWLATHSIGMMRRARDIALTSPGKVVFLDFEGKDFDQPQTLEPIVPNRVFWQRVLRVALDDLSELVAPQQIIICEGPPKLPGVSGSASLDADCYNRIFEQEFPDTTFVSGGNSSEVESDRIALLETLKGLVKGANVLRLIDRDDHSPEDILEKIKQGVRVLSKRNIESYLYDDEVLLELCNWANNPEAYSLLMAEKSNAIERAMARGKPKDDLKAASGEIYNAAKKYLEITGVGNNAKAFMRSVLAPLLKPGMVAYSQLRHDIFGPPSPKLLPNA